MGQRSSKANPARPLTVTYRETASLKPDPRNTRTHPKRQVDQIIASIREFGFTNPILVDPNGAVIAGHGRLLAANSMGLTEVPTIELAELHEAQKRALRVADNKIALNARWDTDLLKQELGELSSLDIDLDLSLTGFSTGELDVLLRASEDSKDDVIPPVPANPRTRLGDMWLLGEHVIGCGDSEDRGFLQKVLGDNTRADAAFLDLAHNMRTGGHCNAKDRRREFAMASGEMSEAAFRRFLEETLGAAAQVSRDGAVHFVCSDWQHMDDVSAVGRMVYGELLNLCIWNKSNAGKGALYRSKHELVFVFKVGTGPHFDTVALGRHGRTDVWDYASVNWPNRSRREGLALPATVKPTALVADAIQDVTRHGDLVLDSCFGYGTTLIACDGCGRRFRGVELDPACVDIAIERWTAVTGGTPEPLERSHAA